MLLYNSVLYVNSADRLMESDLQVPKFSVYPTWAETHLPISIIQLMRSVMVLLKVIPLSGIHCKVEIH